MRFENNKLLVPAGYFTIVCIVLINFLIGQDTLRTEVFDPNTLNDPEPNWPTVVNPLFNEKSALPEKPVSDTIRIIVNGYRVQVLATKFAEKADSLRKELSDAFPNEVYVSFEAPNYKVRVGNCVDRRKAETLRKQLKALGYQSAWIVRTRIEKQPSPAGF